MIDPFENINPWAEKLQQVNLPDAETSWQSMQSVLEDEMPVSKGNGWKGWLMLSVLLMLLFGVCNCPGVINQNSVNQNADPSSSGKTHPSDQTAVEAIKNNHSVTITTPNKGNTSVHKTMDTTMTRNTAPMMVQNKTVERPRQEANFPGELSKSGENFRKALSITFKYKKGKKGIRNQPARNPSPAGVLVNHAGHARETAKHPVLVKPDLAKSNGKKSSQESNNRASSTHLFPRNPATALKNEASLPGQLHQKPGKVSIYPTLETISEKQISIGFSEFLSKKSVLKPTLSNLAQAANGPSKKDSISRKRWALAAGLGLNQFFALGSQVHSDYNSSGTSGSIADYIPVPMFRVYLNPKTFFELEAQFNTPQYTRQLLAKQVESYDSVTGNVAGAVTFIHVQNTVYIKKLFYFNVPLMFHYSPWKHAYFGTGLEYSQLTNGIGLFSLNQFDPLNSNLVVHSDSKVASIKNSSVYQELKTHEFRLMLDAQYQWKNLVLGARYNQALSKFINVQISNTQVTEARNSSIQLYLRYILWKNFKY